MKFSRSDLADFAYFLAIARNRSFRRASLELGISASALSHALKGLEERHGVRLLNRTNRSVTLTAAGEAFRDAIAEHFDAIDHAAEVLNRFRDAPAGRIRLNVPEDAAELILAPVLPRFVELYPDIEIDLSIDNRMIDVIDQGYDAGIRYGGTVPEDMIVQRISPPMRWVVAGSPAYFERFGTPQVPQDLMNHRCMKIRLGNDRIYHWEFEKGDEAVALAVPGPLTIGNSRIGLHMALSGAALIYAAEPSIAGAIAEGRLAIALDEWGSMGEAFHVYYSSRRQVPSGLRLLVDLIREMRPLGF
ncbi:LysR substrate-binding domain-containing protein [Novosphingobium aerophilum]|nr:LysR substrate-binding domain-containing protein [Novosphingobium sp. RL4]WRT95430.1 LysR substrate-binding domain-containing protein [Novosphingobium sp. RL4]